MNIKVLTLGWTDKCCGCNKDIKPGDKVFVLEDITGVKPATLHFCEDCINDICSSKKGGYYEHRRKNIQKIADLIFSINFFHKEIADRKMNINYLKSLSCGSKVKYEVDNRNFRFESLDIIYLEKTLGQIKKEFEALNSELRMLNSKVNDEDYK